MHHGRLEYPEHSSSNFIKAFDNINCYIYGKWKDLDIFTLSTNVDLYFKYKCNFYSTGLNTLISHVEYDDRKIRLI